MDLDYQFGFNAGANGSEFHNDSEDWERGYRDGVRWIKEIREQTLQCRIAVETLHTADATEEQRASAIKVLKKLDPAADELIEMINSHIAERGFVF